MLVATERGDTFTEKEMRSWFTSCGIKNIKVIPVPNNALIIGTK
jgi:hypothetical protein